MVISEVCYWPKPNEPEWIELANVSDKPVDVKDWEIIDGQTLDIKISEQSLVIPPKSFLVIILDGKEKSATPFKNNQSTIHSAKGIKGNLLGDKGGQIALYSLLNDGYELPVIHSFVAWGRSPGSIISDAINVQYWTQPQETVAGTGPDILLGLFTSIQQGGSIGLLEPKDKAGIKYKNWVVFLPADTNPGQSNVNKRRPDLAPYVPDGAKTDEHGFRNLTVVPMEEGVKYQFQVCYDRACQQVFLNHIGNNFDYHLAKPIPPQSTYYWRARLIYPDGTASGWSEVRSITHKIKE